MEEMTVQMHYLFDTFMKIEKMEINNPETDFIFISHCMLCSHFIYLGIVFGLDISQFFYSFELHIYGLSLLFLIQG